MKAYRIHLTSWTASFRYPNLISGYQPSMVAPPLSTIYGLISAAVGNYLCANDLAVGYLFNFDCQTIEIETIYQFTSKSSRLTTKSNIIRRQILFNNSLWLYLEDFQVAESFLKPNFQMLLGRSNDLASVDAVDEIDLEPLPKLSKLKGTVIPMGTIPLAAPIQALPIGFTNKIPRRSISTRPFYILEYDYKQTEPICEKGFHDKQLDHQIYWHDYTDTL